MMATTDTTRADALITKYIGPHPSKPGLMNAWLKERGVPVWAIIGHLEVVEGDADQAASDYAVPREAIDAALAYYERYKPYIDARLLLNRDR